MTGSERRRRTPDTPLGYLEGLPSLTLLDRLQIPMLAVHDGGDIIYANPAVEEMLGYRHGWLANCTGGAVFRGVPQDGEPLHMMAYLRERAGSIVDLAHWDGSTVRAIVSGPTFLRSDDPVALVSLVNVTERLWHGDPTL